MQSPAWNSRLRHPAALQPCSEGLSLLSVFHLPIPCPSAPLSSVPGIFPCLSPQCSSSSPGQTCKSSWPLPSPSPALSICLLKSSHISPLLPVPCHLLFRNPLVSHLDCSIATAAFAPASAVHSSQKPTDFPQSDRVTSTWLPLALGATHTVQVSVIRPFVRPVSWASEYATSMCLEALYISHLTPTPAKSTHAHSSAQVHLPRRPPLITCPARISLLSSWNCLALWFHTY